MTISNPHLSWFKLKCPYPVNSKAYASAKAKLNNASHPDLERLRAEFDDYQDGSTPVTHYNLYDVWFASEGGVKAHATNMKGIQRHGRKLQGAKTCEWSNAKMDIRNTGTGSQKTGCYLCQSGCLMGARTRCSSLWCI